MALGPRLDIRQTQQLVMTPQLQQAIRLLALSNLEVESFIAEELDRNPLLETGSDDAPTADGEEAEAPQPAEAEEPETVDQLVMNGDAQRDSPLDVDFNGEDFHQDSAADSIGGLDGSLGLTGDVGGRGFEDAPDYDTLANGELSLHEHLLAQARSTLADTDLVIASQIIEAIDEAGYFLASLTEIAQRRGAPQAEVERVLGIVQTFDPAGIAARSLSECLAIQAREADR